MNQQPVALNVAIAGFISSCVTLAAIFWPDRLSPEVQAAIISVANAAIVVVTILLTMRQVTPVANPTLPAGTSVNVQNTEDKVLIAPTPPGPTGIDSTSGGQTFTADDGGIG
jgi:hypothetical protein